MDQRCRQWDCIKMTVAGGTICDSLRCNSMDSQNDRLPLTANITAVRNEYPLHCSNVACLGDPDSDGDSCCLLRLALW